jgi:hypothetical protein
MATLSHQSRQYANRRRSPRAWQNWRWSVEAQVRRFRQSLRRHADGIVWRASAIGLLPNLILCPHRFPPASVTIGTAYMSRFWRPKAAGEWIDIAVALLGWPAGVAVCASWYTIRNGAVVAKRFGRSRLQQLGDQLRLAVTSGLLPPWYYIFELYRPGEMGLARCYLTRGQTKRGAYRILAEARGSSSPLSDKEAFALFCAERRIAALPVLLSAHDGELRGEVTSVHALPRCDLFVKPVRARGGRGAERWDHAGRGLYRHCSGRQLSAAQFLERLRAMSGVQPLLVQERARNHPAMSDLTNGALNTIRMISCLDEHDRPEIMAAVQRMAVGTNETVDNVHAGGMGVPIDLASGRLLQGTDMGIDAHMGWIDFHPTTGGRITGRALPMWEETCALVRTAHFAFSDWVVIGWDVAVTADGPRLVEGNSGPDIDLIQRPMRRPFGNARFGELLAHHLNRPEVRRHWANENAPA